MVTRSRKRVRRYRVARSAKSAAVSSSSRPVCTSSAAGTERAEPGEKSPSDGYWHMTARYTTVISRKRAHLFLFISNPLSGIGTGPKWLPAPSSEIGQLMTDHWSTHLNHTRICIT